jgi:hypothetical protein
VNFLELRNGEVRITQRREVASESPRRVPQWVETRPKRTKEAGGAARSTLEFYTSEATRSSRPRPPVSSRGRIGTEGRTVVDESQTIRVSEQRLTEALNICEEFATVVSLMLTSEGIDTEGLYRTMNRVQSHTSERISQLSKELAERGLEAQIAQRELYKEDSIRKPPD